MRLFLLAACLFGNPTVRDDVEREVSAVENASKKMEESQPNSPEYNNAAQSRQQGMEQIQLVASRNSNDPNAQMAVANAYMRLGNYSGAYDVAARAAKLQPNNADAWYLLSASAHGLGRSADAEKLARKALQLNSRHEGAFAILKLAEGRGNSEPRPRAPGPGGGKMSRPDVNFHQQQGAARQSSASVAPGRTTASRPTAAAPAPALPAGLGKTTLKVTSADELKSDVLTEQARAKVGLDPAAAVKLLDQAIVLNPKNADAYSERARAKLAAGEPQSSIEADLLMAAKLDPNFSLSYEDLIVSVGLVPGAEATRPAPAPLRDQQSAQWNWMSLWKQRGTNPGLVAAAAGLVLIAICVGIYFFRKLMNKAEVVPAQEP